MGNIAAVFDAQDPFVGASTVIGDFDLLVELGGDDRQALIQSAASLRDVAGVARIEVAFADTRTTPSS